MDQTIHRKAFYNSILIIATHVCMFTYLWTEMVGCEAFVHIQTSVRTQRSAVRVLTSKSTSLSMSSTKRKSGKSRASSSPSLQIKTVPTTSALEPSDSPTEYDFLSSNTEKPISSKCLQHIAFICDGNSRWANQTNKTPTKKNSHPQSNSKSITNTEKTQTRTMPFQNEKEQIDKIRGHAKGAQQVTNLIQHINRHYPSVKHVTIYGFSSENWSRSYQEIQGIFGVMERTATSIRDWALKEGLRVKLLGDCDDVRIPVRVRRVLTQLEADSNANANANANTNAKAKAKANTQSNSNASSESSEPLTLCIAVNYGGRNDIISATRKIAELVQNGEMEVDDIDQDTVEKLLGTSGIPDPDLVIRTGGEKRLSNFLIWNCAYSELYFTDILWPDFGGDELDEAMEWYYGRDRRFGGRSDDE